MMDRNKLLAATKAKLDSLRAADEILSKAQASKPVSTDSLTTPSKKKKGPKAFEGYEDLEDELRYLNPSKPPTLDEVEAEMPKPFQEDEPPGFLDLLWQMPAPQSRHLKQYAPPKDRKMLGELWQVVREADGAAQRGFLEELTNQTRNKMMEEAKPFYKSPPPWTERPPRSS